MGVVALGVVALPFVAAGGAVALAWRFRGELADVAAFITAPVWLPVKLLSDSIAHRREIKRLEAQRPIVIVVNSQADAQRLLETHSGAKLLTDRSSNVIELPSQRHADRLEVKR